MNHIRDIRARGGIFAYNTAPYQSGHISAPAYAQLKRIGEEL